MFKKTLAAVAVLGAFAGSAFAANVTMYGIIDTGLGYTSTDKGYGEDVNNLKVVERPHETLLGVGLSN